MDCQRGPEGSPKDHLNPRKLRGHPGPPELFDGHDAFLSEVREVAALTQR